MNAASQKISILRHLAKGHSLTALQALRKFGCLRLGARIYELKRELWPITSTLVAVNGKHVAEYRYKHPKVKHARS